MDKTTDYKEIIYLDNIEITSAMAQLNHGLMQSIQRSSGTSKTNTYSTNRDVSAGISIGATGDIQVGKTDSDTNASDNHELINIIFNDYQLEQLLKELNKSDNPVDLASASEGDYVQIKSTFQIYDFAGMAKLNPKLFGNFMRSTGETKASVDESVKGFKNIQYFGEVLSTIIPDITLIKTDGSLSYLEKNNLRMNSGQIQIFSGTQRSIRLLGIVESTALSNDRTIPDFSDEKNLNKISNYMSAFSDIMLQSAGILNVGDKLIKPIAVYF